MINKLYYDSPYIREWTTSIKEVIEREDGLYVILEATAFYPHGGGQPCDTGTINGINVLDVVIEETEILHKVDKMPATAEVTCKIDWDKRFDHMQHHSGQHLLSAVCLNLYNIRTVSFHLGKDYVTIDVEAPQLTQNQLNTIEEEVNQQVYSNRRIQSYLVTNEEVKALSLVKMPKVTENIRIVEIEGIEHNACGGTHVAQTGEIGMIKLYKTEKQKGVTRIYFKCGNRALKDYNETLSIIDTLSTKFNTGRSDILDRIGKWEEEQKELQSQVDILKEKVDSYQANELLMNHDGNLLAHIFEDKSLKDLQYFSAKLATENDLIILLASTSENKIILAHNGTQAISCGALFKEHLRDFNGKGGGNDKSAQAGFSSSEDVVRFFKFVSSLVK